MATVGVKGLICNTIDVFVFTHISGWRVVTMHVVIEFRPSLFY